jgi:hypothetical protein
MHISPEFIAAIVFSVSVVIVGLGTIWVVHWRTKVMLQYRGKYISLCRGHSVTYLTCSSYTGRDLEFQTPIPRHTTESSDMLVTESVSLESDFNSELLSMGPQFRQQTPRQSPSRIPCLTCGDASPPYSIEDVLYTPFSA